MKKFLLIAAASAMTMAATAQTVIAPPTIEEAKAAGYPSLWETDPSKYTYAYGYVLPNGYVCADNDEVKVVMDNGSEAKPGANISTSGLNSPLFDRAFNMGSAAGFGFTEPLYALSAISDGIKQPYAIFTVEPKVGGELTLYASRGKNKFTMYVWDTTVNEGVGTFVLESSAQPGDAGKSLVNKATVGLTEGHTYWVYGSETGANTQLYEMVFTPYTAESYSIKEFDASKFSTVIVPPTIEEAKAAGYPSLWETDPSQYTYAYGYVLPNGYVCADNDELKVVMDNGSESKPGANISTSGLNSPVFTSAFNMGSAAGFGFTEPLYALSAISDGIKQPYAIFTIEAKIGGELTLYASRGKNKFTMYVWDTTVNEGVGTFVLESSAQPGDAGKSLVNASVVGLTEGHTYWVYASETGANTQLYAMGYNTISSPNYGYTGDSTGIADVIVDNKPQDDAIYNILGQKVTEDYKGLVIKNGKKYIQK